MCPLCLQKSVPTVSATICDHCVCNNMCPVCLQQSVPTLCNNLCPLCLQKSVATVCNNMCPLCLQQSVPTVCNNMCPLCLQQYVPTVSTTICAHCFCNNMCPLCPQQSVPTASATMCPLSTTICAHCVCNNLCPLCLQQSSSCISTSTADNKVLYTIEESRTHHMAVTATRYMPTPNNTDEAFAIPRHTHCLHDRTCTVIMCSKCSLLYQPQIIDNECGVIGGMTIGRGQWSTRRKPTPAPLCPKQIPHYLIWARTWAYKVGTEKLHISTRYHPLRTNNKSDTIKLQYLSPLGKKA
jgi:hypothetical protein